MTGTDIVCVRSYPEGPRVWVAGQRVHHGASGSLLGVACLALRRPRLAALLLAWAATDWHDVRVWFARECVPAGVELDGQTPDIAA